MLPALVMLLGGCTPPGRRMKTLEESIAATKPVQKTEGATHTVERGETLFSISRLYGVPIGGICSANSLTTDSKIYPGQQLFIPGAKASKNESIELLKKDDGGVDEEPVAKAPPKPQPPAKPGPPPKAEFRFVRPMVGAIVKGFGDKTVVDINHGIDIAGVPGMEVKAAKSGIVLEVTTRGVWNCLIIIDHGEGEKTVYGHIDKAAVAAGDRVKQGQVIGTLADVGREGKTVLHFRIYRDGEPIDPAGKFSD